MEQPKREKPYQKPTGERRGLVLVYTGEGKGKTTAALGLVLRAVGRGYRARIFQFMKHERAAFGEHRALERLGVEIEGLGDGFSWKSKDLDHSAALAYKGWQKAREILLSGTYFLVVWDEISYPIRYGWIPLEEVLQALEQKPKGVHLVLTGRGMPEEIIERADTASEVRKVKHAFDAGVPAQRGIEH
ncbi:Cob(I)yrinic acid a,c-diamide adenosyltransferase [Meiothermus luteus]|jgi:cob(I)alamin adenosyltransferase|uniref:Cob(I)yrinic acid a,c-diamide adenosyltransferase n=1 Tax=Meiothermus luteus TaxID=2026184 RepID=A0A399EUU9_9DEIN|nr:cob(I)yrinic acid a,c-diamide adenosyltransferase [Meiothermus luteus]RIH87330.1 Cob(I)yrinic acid a,c-diamide adenosyltransferase [Meiothermus luteus]RMH53606.1 MAG: cob(I)yrinic acid a,c-diamide adenosyltransferase [Deinococcota bacterium]